jgi:hypothetical protein
MKGASIVLADSAAIRHRNAFQQDAATPPKT